MLLIYSYFIAQFSVNWSKVHKIIKIVVSSRVIQVMNVYADKHDYYVTAANLNFSDLYSYIEKNILPI